MKYVSINLYYLYNCLQTLVGCITNPFHWKAALWQYYYSTRIDYYAVKDPSSTEIMVTDFMLHKSWNFLQTRCAKMDNAFSASIFDRASPSSKHTGHIPALLLHKSLSHTYLRLYPFWLVKKKKKSSIILKNLPKKKPQNA